MSFKTKIIAFTSLFAFIVSINIWAILNYRTDLYFILRPLETLFLIVFYLLIVNKVKWFYVFSLVCVLVANFFYFYDAIYFVVAMLFYTINHILLGLEIFKFRNIRVGMLFKYFSTLCVALIIIYFFVLKSQGHNTSVLIFGVSLCLVVAVSLVNYLRNMNLPNFYLLLGLLIGLITNIIVSLNVFSLSSDRTLILLTTVLFAMAHYFIYYSFVAREKYEQLNKPLS